MSSLLAEGDNVNDLVSEDVSSNSDRMDFVSR